MIAQTLLDELNITPKRCMEIVDMISPYIEERKARIVIYNTIMTAGLTDKERLLAFYLWGCEEGYVGYQEEEE